MTSGDRNLADLLRRAVSTDDPDDALRAVKLIGPKKVLPIHYNTWDLIAQDANAWADRVRRETGVPVEVLKPGEWLDV